MMNLSAIFGIGQKKPKKSRYNFTGYNLRGADLSCAPFHGIIMVDINLERTYAREADLSDANLENANLKDGNFKYANLSGAHLAGANLSGANLANTNLKDAVINNTNFTGARYLTQAQLDECIYIPDLADAENTAKPTLPKGLKPTYKVMTHQEWQNARD